MSKAQIFISYRRADTTLLFIENLFQKLIEQGIFSQGDIFWDTKFIRGGDNWNNEIRNNLLSCNIVLVVIGHNWQIERLQSQDDYVRLEIETALFNNKFLIPVIVGDIDLPDVRKLPSNIQVLIEKQFRFIKTNQDIIELIQDILQWYRKNITGRIAVSFESSFMENVLGTQLWKTWNLASIRININGDEYKEYEIRNNNLIYIYLKEGFYVIQISIYLGPKRYEPHGYPLGGGYWTKEYLHSPYLNINLDAREKILIECRRKSDYIEAKLVK